MVPLSATANLYQLDYWFSWNSKPSILIRMVVLLSFSYGVL